MAENKNKCDCSPLSRLDMCDDETATSSADTEVIVDTNTIEPTDQILVLRGQKVYKASWKDLSPKTALLILEQSTKTMPRTDPSDGCSLWIDGGFIKIASGDANNLGMQSQVAFDKNLQISIENLPTYDPGDGKPWLCGGVVMIGQNRTTQGCK